MPADEYNSKYVLEETLNILETCARTKSLTPEWDIPSGYNELEGYASYLKDKELTKGLTLHGNNIAQGVLDLYPQSEASKIKLKDNPNGIGFKPKEGQVQPNHTTHNGKMVSSDTKSKPKKVRNSKTH